MQKGTIQDIYTNIVLTDHNNRAISLGLRCLVRSSRAGLKDDTTSRAVASSSAQAEGQGAPDVVD